MELPVSFVRLDADDRLNLRRRFSLPGERRGQTRKIFVIKETSRVPSINAAGRKIRRILIFDNHPDSLHLIFGRRRSPYPSAPRRTSSWELTVVSILTI